MNKNTPINYDTVKDKISKCKKSKVGNASIREIVRIVNEIETETGEKFIRMEMGVPGLTPPEIGTEAEIAALRRGVAAKYPMIDGVADLKDEAQRFVKLFLDLDISREHCLPSVGSMQGSYATFSVINRTDRNKEGTLFIDPGFPVQKQQVRMMGHDFMSFDVYNYRGEALHDKLESYLKTGKVSSIMYSNPNNPSWICFTERELQIIGELATKYDAVVIEDLAYFGMDFRKDFAQPGVAPYQPTVAHYTDNYILLISSSKVFSYAGQRVGIIAVSGKLFEREYPDLTRYFPNKQFGHSLVFGALYSLSSGVTHSSQYAVAAMLKAVNDGEFKFIDHVKEYGRRAKIVKRIFTENDFSIVYDKDENEKIADGFFFTFSYPGFSGVDLLEEMLYYGISSISLNITGSERTEGLRACVSQINGHQFEQLETRLKAFYKDHQ